MEENRPIKKSKNGYICLGIVLALTALSIILILAKGLDSNRFLDGVTWPLACLPFSLVFPVYVCFDMVDHSASGERSDNYFPMRPERDDRVIKISFLVALATAAATIILFLTLNNSDSIDPVRACFIYLIPNVPIMLLYLVPICFSCFQLGKKKEGIIVTSLLVVGVGVAIMLIFGINALEPTFLVGYLTYPLIVIILLLYGRAD